jgi:hypothetical protein
MYHQPRFLQRKTFKTLPSFYFFIHVEQIFLIRAQNQQNLKGGQLSNFIAANGTTGNSTHVRSKLPMGPKNNFEPLVTQSR